MNDEAIAYVAIDRLLRRYADLSTRGTYHELASLATPDAVFIFDTFSGQRFEVEGTQDFIDFSTKRAGGFSFFEYVTLNFVVDFGGAERPAVASTTSRSRATPRPMSSRTSTASTTTSTSSWTGGGTSRDGTTAPLPDARTTGSTCRPRASVAVPPEHC